MCIGGILALRAQCVLLLAYVPPEEPPGTPLGNTLRKQATQSGLEHPKKPYPQCIEAYCQTTMMPKVPQSMGFYYSQTPK